MSGRFFQQTSGTVRPVLFAALLIISGCSTSATTTQDASGESAETSTPVSETSEVANTELPSTDVPSTDPGGVEVESEEPAESGAPEGSDSESQADQERATTTTTSEATDSEPESGDEQSNDQEDGDDTTPESGEPDEISDSAVGAAPTAAEEVASVDEPVAAPTATTTTTTTVLPGSSGDAELDALVDELSAYVEAERGLDFQRRPQIDLLDEAEFSSAWVQLISEDAAENVSAFRNFTDIYQTMGIISPDTSLEEIWTRFGDAGVLGYYDSETEQIVLRSGEINTLTKTTLVHELVHALEDQAFNLDRPRYDDREDEISWAFSSVIEGSARVIENRYRATLTQAELDEERVAINALPRSVSFSEFNSSFLELQFGRYNYGETFADALWAQGQSAVDQALLSPPTASELILDPASFLAGTTADAPVAAPPADGPIFEQGVWGEAGWIALLSDVFPIAQSRDIANGWGGDWYVAWNEGEETCVRIDLTADSAGELAQYESALVQWVDQAPDRELSSPSADVLRVSACG